MELIERIPLDKINYLNSLSFKDFKPYCKSSCKNEADRVTQYNILKSFCQTNLKTRGETKRIYSYTLETPLDVGGRLYCGNSIQGLSSIIRGFLFGNTTTDIDMKNAHPTILRYLCKLHKFPCPNLSYYIDNRDEILLQFGDDGKTEFLKCVNDSKPSKKYKNNKLFKDFDKECKDIQTFVTQLECYKHIVDTVPLNKSYNWYGSAINRIMCVYENKILQEVISVLNKRGIEISVLMFDGLMPYGNFYDDSDLLKEIEQHVETKFEGLNMKFTYKEHKNVIQLPTDYQVEKEVNMLSFEIVSDEFEKQHAKIINKGVFIKQLETDVIFMSKQHIKSSYENMIYKKQNKEGELKEANFINDWLVNNPKQKCYDDVGVYPDPSKCPPNIFNMWRPFEMEFINEYEEKKEELEIILNHIRILCNNEVEIYEYFIRWIAQMIQYPDVKTICPTLISKQGAGKGTLMRLFEKMLGSAKMFQTTNPSRDVWGDFNGFMANCFLVNLDELSKKETIESEGKIKGLVSEPKLQINNKGVNKYEINSYHRFIITTNKEEPINTTSEDRRNLIIRSSDEKCGDKEYFKKMYELLDDVNVIKTCYEYFKSIPDMDNFASIKMPCTEYQEELKKMSASPIELWLRDFTFQNQMRDYIELGSASILEKFNEWCDNNGVEYKINSIQLAVRMSRLNITGIEKHKTKSCNKTKFDIEKMKQHFGL